jgi:hypothetical protein
MSGVQELVIRYVLPRERLVKNCVRVLYGTARSYHGGGLIVHGNDRYVVIEYNGKLLFNSRTVFPCDMQEFAKNQERYVAEMASRGFSRESLNLSDE